MEVMIKSDKEKDERKHRNGHRKKKKGKWKRKKGK